MFEFIQYFSSRDPTPPVGRRMEKRKGPQKHNKERNKAIYSLSSKVKNSPFMWSLWPCFSIFKMETPHTWVCCIHKQCYSCGTHTAPPGPHQIFMQHTAKGLSGCDDAQSKGCMDLLPQPCPPMGFLSVSSRHAELLSRDLLSVAVRCREAIRQQHYSGKVQQIKRLDLASISNHMRAAFQKSQKGLTIVDLLCLSLTIPTGQVQLYSEDGVKWTQYQ